MYMYEVFNIKTDHIVRRCKDVSQANMVARDFEHAYEWVDGSKFDYRVMDEDSSREYKRRQIARRIRARGGSLNGTRMVRRFS